MQAESVNTVEAVPTRDRKSPKVSVCVVTYNQEKYIAQCLQSIIDQVTDFDFEIIVGDDCSKDGTRRIVREFAAKYPGKIRLFLHEKNMGAYRNFVFVHSQPLADYVAHIDGDDYALPGKLQAQADLLDEDKNCNIVWTPVLIEAAPGELHEQNAFFKKYALMRRYTRADLIKYGTVGVNSSKMYRKKFETEALPPPDFEVIDYFVNVMQVGKGVARFAGDKPLGVYRLGIGIASSGGVTKNLSLKSVQYFARNFPQYRLEANTATGFRLLSDIKNKRPEFSSSLNLFVKTFHWRVFFSIAKEWKFVRNLTLRS